MGTDVKQCLHIKGHEAFIFLPTSSSSDLLGSLGYYEQNHRIFTLRCLKEDLIPVSVKLRSNFKTPRAKIITRKVERALPNERIRIINNTIAMATSKRDTCMNAILEVFPKEIMEECARLIFLRREAYYIKVKNRQIAKLE